MGGFVDGLFGGSAASVSTPEYVAAPAREAEKEPESRAVRDAEKRKLAARQGMSGTILTSPLGTSGAAASQSGGASGILGRSLS